MINHYKTLGVDNLATHKQIKDAGKKLKAELQDREVTGVHEQADKLAKKQINEALEILLDPEEREMYDIELDNAPLDTIVDPTKPLYFNLGAIRESFSQPWRDAIEWDGKIDITLYRNLLRRTAKLPFPDIQEDIFLAAVLTPMPLAMMLPILFCQGVSGSGKSNLGKFAYTIYGNRPVVGATTYAAIRRKVEKLSRVVDCGRQIDLLHCMVWDDISLPIMRSSPQMYSFIKSCYDRETAVIEMADKDSDGGIIKFHCFGMRVFSSVYPYYSDEYFSEMNRRMLIFETHKSKDTQGLISYGSTNWDGLARVTSSLWENPDNHGTYGTYKRQVCDYANIGNHDISSERVNLCTDLLTTGLVLSIWEDVEQAFDALERFYDSTDELIRGKQSPVFQIVKNFLSERERMHDSLHRDYPIFIKPNELSIEVKSWQGKEVIDRALRAGELSGIMNDLGWELNVKAAEWVKS